MDNGNTVSPISRHEPVSLVFSGLNDRSGPWTWGQRWIGQILQELSPYEARVNGYLVLPLPEGTTLVDVIHALKITIETYEALRTRYYIETPEDLGQKAQGSDTVFVTVWDVEGSQVDCAAAASQMLSELQGLSFRPIIDLPVRAGVVTSGGQAKALVMTMWHLSSDGWSTAQVGQQIFSVLEGQSLEEGAASLLHPMDRAYYEATDACVQRGRRALRYWRDQLTRAPLNMMPVQPQVPHVPQYWNATFTSSQLARDAKSLAKEIKVSEATILFTATALLLMARSSQPRGILQLIASNRTDANSRLMVGSIAQATVVSVEASGQSFRECVRRTWATTLQAYRSAYYDPRELNLLKEEVKLSSGHIADLSCGFNFYDWMPPMDETRPIDVLDPSLTPAVGRLTWDDKLVWNNIKFYLHVKPGQHETRLELHTDTAHISPSATENYLYALERFVSSARQGRDDIKDLVSVSNLEVLVPGEGWALLACGWVDIMAMRQMLTEASNGSQSAIFVTSSASEPSSAIAYIAVDDTALTITSIHEAAVALLDSYATATPDYYVLCAIPPGDTNSIHAWRASGVVMEGDGR